MLKLTSKSKDRKTLCEIVVCVISFQAAMSHYSLTLLYFG